MPVLHLGVAVQSYGEVGVKQGNKIVAGAPDTGDVAQWLEDKYGLMQAFFNAHEQDIAGALEGSVSKALESMMMGAPVNHDAFGAAAGQIEEMFKDFISSGEAEQVGIAGTPTGAALRGVNHRLKHPYAKANPRRVSFRDTGLFQSSFKAWVD